MPASQRITLGKIITLGIFIFPCLIVLIIGDFLVYLLFWQDFRVKQSLQVYEGADKIGEYRTHFGADNDNKDLYYWTEDSINAVKQHYEAHFPAFQYATTEKTNGSLHPILLAIPKADSSQLTKQGCSHHFAMIIANSVCGRIVSL